MIQCITGQTVYTDIKLNAEEEHNIPLTFTDSSGTAIDITGATITIVALRNMTDLLTLAELNKAGTIVSGVGGTANIQILPAETNGIQGKFYMSVKLVLSTGTKSIVIKGYLIVENISAREV